MEKFISASVYTVFVRIEVFIAILLVIGLVGVGIGSLAFSRTVTKTETVTVTVTETISSSITTPRKGGRSGDLTFTIGRFYTDEIGFCHVVGEVTNHGSRTAKWVEVIASFYDAEGNMIGTSFAYTDPEHIPPGSTVPYHIIWTDKAGCRRAERVKVQLTYS